jgi:hypothetical protein
MVRTSRLRRKDRGITLVLAARNHLPKASLVGIRWQDHPASIQMRCSCALSQPNFAEVCDGWGLANRKLEIDRGIAEAPHQNLYSES